MKNKTLLLGASENPGRYSNMALLRLLKHGHEVIAIGKNAGKVKDAEIITFPIATEEIDTVTLYLNPENQRPYYDYILSLKPRRIIFNPGAENEELEAMASAKGIEVMEACTLVLLGIGSY